MQESDTGPTPGSGEGPVILVVGILGLFMQALGPVAWIWGNKAITRAKPNEAGLIQAGRILGIIDTVILVFAVVVGVVYYIFMLTVMAPMFRDLSNQITPPNPPAVHAPKPAHTHKLPANVQTHPVSSQ